MCVQGLLRMCVFVSFGVSLGRHVLEVVACNLPGRVATTRLQLYMQHYIYKIRYTTPWRHLQFWLYFQWIVVFRKGKRKRDRKMWILGLRQAERETTHLREWVCPANTTADQHVQAERARKIERKNVIMGEGDKEGEHKVSSKLLISAQRWIQKACESGRWAEKVTAEGKERPTAQGSKRATGRVSLCVPVQTSENRARATKWENERKQGGLNWERWRNLGRYSRDHQGNTTRSERNEVW